MKVLQLSIRSRILVGFALPIALFIAFTFWLGGQLTQVRQNLVQVSEQSVQHALMAADLDKNVVQIQQYLSDISATRGKDGLDDGFDKAKENYEALKTSLGVFEKHFRESNETDLLSKVEKLRTKSSAYYEKGQQMAKAYVSGGPEAGNKLMSGFDQASDSLQQDLKPFVHAQLERMKADLGASITLSNQIYHSALVIVGVAVVLALLVAWVVTSSITRPLRKALGVANLVAAGNLDTPIEADGSEIGQLLAPLGKMKDTLLSFEAAQHELARQHELGMIEYVMPVQQLEGSYRTMGESINSLMQSHIAVQRRIVDVVSGYADGKLDVPMDRLPGQKARISESIDRVQTSLREAATAAITNMRVVQALNKASANVMIADNSNTIIFMNPTVQDMILSLIHI